MTKQELLILKMETEFQLFILGTLRKSPEEIMNASYEKVMKEDLIFGLRGKELPENSVDYLLKSEKPLEALYQNWLDSDISYMEALMGSVENYVSKGMYIEKERRTRER